MAYTKRTCHACGYRDIQPNMHQMTIMQDVGTSNTGLAGRTIAGSLLGSQKSQKQFSKWLLAPNKRTYQRKKQVWVCDQCANPKKPERSWLGKIITGVFQFFMWSILVVAVLGFLNSWT